MIYRPVPLRGAPALFGVVAASLVLAACSSGATRSSSSGEATLTVTTPAAPGAIDTLNVALPYGEPTSIDPAFVGDYSPSAVEANMCEGLVKLDANFNVRAGLASQIEKPNDTTMVFDLRPGVTFWDGKPLAPDDVVYSLKRLASTTNGSVWSDAYKFVKSIGATGPEQVTVKFTAPDPGFLQTMGTAGGGIVEKAFTEKAGANSGTPNAGVMCTGPLEFASWEAGKRITLTRNSKYWDRSELSKAETVKFSFVSDNSTLTSALEAGEFDIAYEVPQLTADALATSRVGTVYNGPSTQSLDLSATGNPGPMQNANVRKALDLAIDKAAIAKTVFGGAATPLNSPVAPFTWGQGASRSIYLAGYTKLANAATPGLDEAKKLVKDAKLSDTNFVVATGAGDEISMRVLIYVQQVAQQIGLNMTIKQFQPADFSNMFYDASARKGVDLIYNLGYSETANPALFAGYSVLKGGLFNWTGYDDPAVQADLNASIHATHPDVAAQKFVDAQAAFAPLRLSIPIVAPDEHLFLKKGFSGAPASFGYLNMPWAAMVGASR